jgi:hypothetical protein
VQGIEESVPVEVKRLVGMKMPPKVVNREQADIPGYVVARGRLLDWLKGNKSSGVRLAYVEGVVDGKWPVLLVKAIYIDRTIEILDAQILPSEWIDWRYKDGTFQWIANRYDLSQCRLGSGDGRIVVGLVKPDKKGSSYSTRVKLAWTIDQDDGHITSIPTQGVQCVILGD